MTLVGFLIPFISGLLIGFSIHGLWMSHRKRRTRQRIVMAFESSLLEFMGHKMMGTDFVDRKDLPKA